MFTSRGIYPEAEGRPGTASSQDPNMFIETFSAQGPIVFGRAVKQGGTSNYVEAFSGSDSEFVGVAGHNQSASDYDNYTYENQDVAGIFTRGRVWVEVEESVSPSDPVRVRYAGTGNEGAFLTTETIGETALLDGAKFLSSTTGAGLAQLQLTDNVTATDDA